MPPRPSSSAHFGLASRRDLPGIDELKAAGLLDPVDDAYDDLAGRHETEDARGKDADGEVNLARRAGKPRGKRLDRRQA